MAGQGALQTQRIDNFKKRKPVKVGIARANLPDAVFAHKDGSVRFVGDIAGKMRQFGKDLVSHVCMTLRRQEYAQTWRSQ